jgi:hypothetical protein
LTNKYLEKIAEETSSRMKKDMAVEGLVGAGIASGASQRMLGYHTVYHGTTRNNAKLIREQGFDPKKGGGANGASAVHPSQFSREAFTQRSQGKIHVTKKHGVAGMFAAFQMANRKEMPGFVKARVSDKMWRSFKADPDLSIIPDKDAGATTKHKISSKLVAGGKGSMGPLAFMKKKHLVQYYADNHNKVRALKGLGMLATGGALITHAAKRYSDG